MRTLLLLAIIWPALLCAEITGPVTSTGDFTLDWSESGAKLREVDGAGNYIGSWLGSSASISKPDGTYIFWEWLCINLPFSNSYCFSTDTHQVTVAAVVGGPSYPEESRIQAAYQYELRSGDFNNDGKVDVLVDRISAGPIDGTLQSYILYQYSNGLLEAKKPITSELIDARTFPLNTLLNLMPSDFNADGYADHIVKNLNAVMGSSVVDEYIVYAAGSAADKSKPLGGAEIDEEFREFTTDLSHWLNDQNHFANNITNTAIPQFSIGISCGGGITWYSGVAGLISDRFCFPVFRLEGYKQAQTGVNLNALSASTRIDSMYADIENIADDDLWQLSQFAKTVLNVHSFGFDDAGTRQATNHGEQTDLDEKTAALIQFSYMLMAAGQDVVVQQVNVTHDYQVDTEICNTNEVFCTLANIACWGRHYHAPLERKEDHDTPVENADTSDLEDLFGFDNEIKTGVGAPAGLPPNAIANVTEPSHILHDTDGPGFGTCPQPVSGQGSGAVNECSQVYREPYESGGKIKMRTRGFGGNRFALPNQIGGPWIFRKLDEDMVEAINSAADGLCPSL